MMPLKPVTHAPRLAPAVGRCVFGPVSGIGKEKRSGP